MKIAGTPESPDFKLNLDTWLEVTIAGAAVSESRATLHPLDLIRHRKRIKVVQHLGNLSAGAPADVHVGLDHNDSIMVWNALEDLASHPTTIDAEELRHPEIIDMIPIAKEILAETLNNLPATDRG